jgi:hypothetical protein
MSNLRSTIEALASQFATSVLDALRRTTMDELLDVAGSGGGPVRRGPGRPRNVDIAAVPAGPAAGRRRGRLGRRSAGDITHMIESIVGALQGATEGMRAEQIREALGVEAKELPRPLAEAISTGRITKTGQKRATTYFAGSGSGGGAGAGGSAGAAPKRRGRKPGSKNKKR